MYGTACVLVAYFLLIVFKSDWTRDVEGQKAFFSYDYTNVMKGLCCILVILVHVPENFTNPLQKAVGGFSQVSVTLYFLFSAYGLMWGIRNKPDYLKNFWKHRVLVLMIPYMISCAVKTLAGYHHGSGGSFFVCVLLLFYTVTYCAVKYIHKHASLAIVVCVLVYSVVGSATDILRWPTQALGFAYGVILAEYLYDLKKWFTTGYTAKLCSITVIAAVLTLTYVLAGEKMPRWIEITLQNIMVLALILWVFLVTFRLNIGNAVSRFLGKISYDIFLYHGLVQTLLVSFTESEWGMNLSSGTFLILLIAFSIVLASIMHVMNGAIVRWLKTV